MTEFSQKTVYAIQHNITKRIYVGISKNPEMRVKKHLYALIQGSHTNTEFQNDFNKFGMDYSFFLLEKDIPCELSVLRERQWINLLRSNERYRGYNLSNQETYIDDMSRFDLLEITLNQGNIFEVTKNCNFVKQKRTYASDNTSKSYQKVFAYCKKKSCLFLHLKRCADLQTEQ